MESELDALAHAVVPTLWLRELLKELIDDYEPSTVIIFQDNQGTIQHCKNEQSSNRTAHLQRRYHFVKQYIELNQIELKHLAGTEMVADQLTKILPREVHEKHCRQFMTVSDFTADPFFRSSIPEEIVEEARKQKAEAKQVAEVKECAQVMNVYKMYEDYCNFIQQISTQVSTYSPMSCAYTSTHFQQVPQQQVYPFYHQPSSHYHNQYFHMNSPICVY